jgi:hypothetical protein
MCGLNRCPETDQDRRTRSSRTVDAPKPRRSQHRNRPIGEDAARRERAGHALDLRIAGASYRQIARRLNIADATAYGAVQEELGRLDALNREKAERLRDLEARRLDHLTISLQSESGPAIHGPCWRWSVLSIQRCLQRERNRHHSRPPHNHVHARLRIAGDLQREPRCCRPRKKIPAPCKRELRLSAVGDDLRRQPSCSGRSDSHGSTQKFSVEGPDQRCALSRADVGLVAEEPTRSLMAQSAESAIDRCRRMRRPRSRGR